MTTSAHSQHSQQSDRRSPVTPIDAVEAWWAAMQSGDLDTLASLLADDYIVSGGPTGRLVGRSAVLEQTARFSGEARIDDWAIDDLEVRGGADHAVCAYQWWEIGSHRGVRFELCGAATDVLQRHGDTWIHQARHVSTTPPADNET